VDHILYARDKYPNSHRFKEVIIDGELYGWTFRANFRLIPRYGCIRVRRGPGKYTFFTRRGARGALLFGKSYYQE
jgi:hypothetical protein